MLGSRHQVGNTSYRSDLFTRVYTNKKTETGLIGSYNSVDSVTKCATICTSASPNNVYNTPCWTFQYDHIKKTCDLMGSWIAGHSVEESVFNISMLPYNNSSVYSSKEEKKFFS